MNFLYKAYCRTFQFCLKVALPFLPYRNVKVLEKTEDIINVLKEHKKVKPMFISDKVLTSLSLTSILENALKENNIDYVFFNDVNANPTTDNVEAGLKLFIENKCDAIICLGGGSVIDLGKGLGARYANKKKSLAKMKGILKVMHKIPLLICIPTTAGTGSETTLASVIVDSKTRHKYAINDFPLIPSYAVLDVRYIESLPLHITSTTGMDALTHAIESYIGKGGNKSTRRDALNAIKLIFENLEKSYKGDTEAKKNMLQASFLAGRSFSKAYVGNVHALAHTLGGKYNTPHGLANAVILPLVLKDYQKAIYKKLHEIAIYTNLISKEQSLEEGYNAVINKIESMNHAMLIPTHLKIEAKDIDELAQYAYKEANPLYPVPCMYSKEKCAEMLRIIGDINE